MSSMEPIPETVEALGELDPSVDPDDLLTRLVELAGRAKDVVPDLVGVSVAQRQHGLTFTLVATAEEVAVLDAVQYVAGGPCVDGARTEGVHEFNDSDVLDEERWRLFSEATAARGVRSTLTLPVDGDGQVTGTVNLYAASSGAFAGRHEELARIFGAWAAGAIANADLSFTTRREARAAPARARDLVVVEVATGLLAADLGIDVEAAGARLREAAAQAGVDPPELAREIIQVSERTGEDDRDDR